MRALCIHLNEATSMFHHVDHHALESAMSRALGLWYSYPGQFRQLMINGMQQDHSWASAGQRSLNIYEYIRHK
jgi:starch synthase